MDDKIGVISFEITPIFYGVSLKNELVYVG